MRSVELSLEPEANDGDVVCVFIVPRFVHAKLDRLAIPRWICGSYELSTGFSVPKMCRMVVWWYRPCSGGEDISILGGLPMQGKYESLPRNQRC